MNEEILFKLKAINLNTDQVPAHIGKLRVRLIDSKSDKLEYDKAVDDSIHFLLNMANVQWELLSLLFLEHDNRENDTDNHPRTSNTTKKTSP